MPYGDFSSELEETPSADPNVVRLSCFSVDNASSDMFEIYNMKNTLFFSSLAVSRRERLSNKVKRGGRVNDFVLPRRSIHLYGIPSWHAHLRTLGGLDSFLVHMARSDP